MSSRLDVLDGMRGFAIFLVVLYHETALTGFRLEWPPFPARPVLSAQWLGATGFVGVELFFFISGFCLFYPYARHAFEGARKPTLREFAFRRFIKIVPSYAVALTVLAIVFHGQFHNAGALLREYLVHLAFLHPLWRDSFYAISGPFWTLGIEVQFYVLFPAIAAAFARMPIVTFTAFAGTAIAYRAWILANGLYPYTFYDNQLPGVIDLFVTGMLGAYLYVRWRPYCERSRIATSAATAVALAAALGGGYALVRFAAAGAADEQWGFYHWEMEHRFGLALLCLLFALGSAFAAGGWRTTIANPTLVWLSTISYNLYLWHDGIIVRCMQSGTPCSFRALPWTTDPRWPMRFLFGSLLIAFAIAVLVTYAFERPLLRWRPAWLRAERR